MKNFPKLLIAFYLFNFNISSASSENHLSKKNMQQFTFSWPFKNTDLMQPRGGTTHGKQVVLDADIGSKWKKLQEKNISKFERDRRAILSMSGAYRVSFDFIETMGFTKNYVPSQPYQTWGTEFVYLVEDSTNFISLQHIIVMFNKDDSKNQKPLVIKHWRQDWKFEDKKLNEYVGFNTWKIKEYPETFSSGKWSQSVFQVDDSPRYQSIGEWIHSGNFSSWESGETWRPLPRREFSVRNDYDVLIGKNVHTITPSGWVQEENNMKVKLESESELLKINPVLSKEIGIARYERILDHDWSAGNKYWDDTNEFWKVVRSVWHEILDKNTLKLAQNDQKAPLFVSMFQLAEESSSKKPDKKEIEEIIKSFIKIN
tara:strand:- start:2483 stop:3598 length:1116 start_codon:yes stop_codon:yes gene_type:complete